mmetsp:Transcript_8257/g.17956  ORF Transcript_8257/g.17956 Transcript_8257/m.17956 type:complete len:841 (-) Transcript_8257:2149-4671(-)
MGQVVSSDSRLPRAWVKFRKLCVLWSLVEVIKARDRFSVIYGETRSFLIGRRQYWEIFTDYSLDLMQNGQFLSLSLELFEIFEQQGLGIVDVREIFCLLALVSSHGILSNKLEVCFPLFGRTMTEERVSQMLSCLQRALSRIGLVVQKAPQNVVMGYAGKICGEGAWRKCRTVSAQLMGDWLLSYPDLETLCTIVFDFNGVDVEMRSKLRDRGEAKEIGSIMRREAKRLLQYVAKAGKKGNKRRETKAASGAPRPSAVVALPGGVVPEDTKRLAPVMTMDAGKVEITSNATIGSSDAVNASFVLKLEDEDLKYLQMCWNNNKTSKKGLNQEQFVEIMITQFPSSSNRTVIGQMYEVFDRNHDGFLDFEEFAMGISRMCSADLEDKIKFLFDVTNANQNKRRNNQGGQVDENGDLIIPAGDDDGEVTMKLMDLVKLVQDTNNEMMECAQFVEILITLMDYNKDGQVQHDEFVRVAKEVPAVVDSFDECFRPSEDLKRFARAVSRSTPQFKGKAIIRGWATLGAQKEQYKFVTWQGFVIFVEPIWDGTGMSPKNMMVSMGHEADEFSPSSNRISFNRESGKRDRVEARDDETYAHLLNLFRAAQPQGENEVIDLRKLIIGVILALNEDEHGVPKIPAPIPIEEKSKLYFELFDIDSSGAVDYQEFFEMLYASQLDMQDAGWISVETLRSLDINRDGTITYDEFMQAIKSNQTILDCFGRIFHATTMDEVEVEESKTMRTTASEPTLGGSPITPGLSHSPSAPALPVNSVYRTTYLFKKKNEDKADDPTANDAQNGQTENHPETTPETSTAEENHQTVIPAKNVAKKQFPRRPTATKTKLAPL